MESDNMLEIWRTLNSEMILDQRWMRVRKDCVELPNGQCLDDYYLWIAGDVALVVPVTQDGKFVVVEQYKHAAGEIMKEFPAGMVDAGESPEEAARRELEEETNYIASQLYKLATLTDNPTKTVGNVHVYLALNVKQGTGLSMDGHEVIRTSLLDEPSLVKEITTGGIRVSGSVSAAFMALEFLRTRNASDA